ncbi:hypothetical protein [Maribacter sp. 2307UL18-2]
MKWVPLLPMLLIYGGLFGVLIYLVIRRIEEKGKEDFEKRDN